MASILARTWSRKSAARLCPSPYAMRNTHYVHLAEASPACAPKKRHSPNPSIPRTLRLEYIGPVAHVLYA
jgi:hypothetical protein